MMGPMVWSSHFVNSKSCFLIFFMAKGQLMTVLPNAYNKVLIGGVNSVAVSKSLLTKWQQRYYNMEIFSSSSFDGDLCIYLSSIDWNNWYMLVVDLYLPGLIYKKKCQLRFHIFKISSCPKCTIYLYGFQVYLEGSPNFVFSILEVMTRLCIFWKFYEVFFILVYYQLGKNL